MFYVMNADRPIGPSPVIYLSKQPDPPNEEWIQISCWYEEFNTEFEVRQFIKQSLGDVKIEIKE